MGMDASASLRFGFLMPSGEAADTWERARILLDDEYIDRSNFEGYVIERSLGTWTEPWTSRSGYTYPAEEMTEWVLATDEELKERDLPPLPPMFRGLYADEEAREKLQKVALIGPASYDDGNDAQLLYMTKYAFGSGFPTTTIGSREDLAISEADLEEFLQLIDNLGIEVEGGPQWYLTASFN